jgi:predicted AlkP superfamily pyrophosphatase or phosphodiesterase
MRRGLNSHKGILQRSNFRILCANSGLGRLISSGAAIPFTAHATSPTITMPRVKAITTGSIPSFLDVILNFAESDTTATLANQDTWLAQIQARKDGKLVMYGDDTWLKLFPSTFTRADGTSSFFVSVSCRIHCLPNRGALRIDRTSLRLIIMSRDISLMN